MVRYLFRRAGYSLLVLWGVVTVVFFLFNLSPGDPVRNLVGENAPAEVVEQIRRKLNLDIPVHQRYFYYLNDLLPLSLYTRDVEGSRRNYQPDTQGGCILAGDQQILVLKWPDLKRSFLSDRPVSGLLAEAMPGTAVLAFVSIALALLAGLLLGMIAALRRDTAADRFILLVSALGMAGPSFFVAILVAWLGAVVWRDAIVVHVLPWLVLGASWWLLRRRGRAPGLVLVAIFIGSWTICAWAVPGGWWNPVITLPGTGLSMTGSLYSVNAFDGPYLDLRNLILPALTLAVRPLAVIVQLTRSSILDVLSQDYIRTARAKGLSSSRILVGHALRNALNPVITAVSGWFASLLAGAVFVEFVFGWKGLGQELFMAIEKQDMPVVMGGVILIASLFVGINMLVDVLYGWVDPRVRRA